MKYSFNKLNRAKEGLWVCMNIALKRLYVPEDCLYVPEDCLNIEEEAFQRFKCAMYMC